LKTIEIMSEFTEAVEVLERIEKTDGTKEGKMMVQGTILMDGLETVHSSFNDTTTVSISRALANLTDICSNIIRTVDPTDQVEFIKINVATREIQKEVIVAPDGDFQAIVVQEHPIRDLRKRSLKEQKSFEAYHYQQNKNQFFPITPDIDEDPEGDLLVATDEFDPVTDDLVEADSNPEKTTPETGATQDETGNSSEQPEVWPDQPSTSPKQPATTPEAS
jgi:hypothetical protein